MQAIELSTTISAQGGIALPANFKALYGRDARMILLIDDDAQLGPPLAAYLKRFDLALDCALSPSAG